MEEWDALGQGMKIDRRSTDWGLLSVTIGACFLIMSPVMLVFNAVFFAEAMPLHTRLDIDITRVATAIIGVLFEALLVFGVMAGFRSLSYARASSQPRALGLGGVLICGLDMLLWLGLGLYLEAVTGIFM